LHPIIKNSFPNEIKSRIKKCGIPVHSLDNAIHDVIKSYKSSFALHKNKKYFRIRYKKKKSNSIVIEPQAFSTKYNRSVCKTIGLIKSSKFLIGINHSCILTIRNGNSSYLIQKIN
jgi:hypothetical protein